MSSALTIQTSLDAAYRVEKQLQGTWNVAIGRWNCQLSFAAHHFAMRFQNGEVYLGIYTVDPTRAPCAMEMTIEEGPERFRGQTALCIYELDGDTLRWCANEPGSSDRHSAFPADGEGKYPVIVFRREGL